MAQNSTSRASCSTTITTATGMSSNTITTHHTTSTKVGGTGSAVRALSIEYKSLQEEPVEGFCVKLVNDDNLFEWQVAIFGPPDTLYMGAYFKVLVFDIISP